MSKDYLAMRKVEGDDKLDHGVKGMKWGRRRSAAQLASAAKARGEPDGQAELLRNKKTGNFHEINPDGSAGKILAGPKDVNSDGSINVNSRPANMTETSSARYNRLKAQAKEKGANSLDDEDLKFFNARTEAMAKINKMNQQNPGWLSETTKKIVQKTTQETLQNVASAVAQQYVTKPVIKSLGAEPPKKKK